MKKLIASIAALVVALGSAFAQDLAAVTEIYNAGAAAVSTDKESALKSFEQALQLAWKDIPQAFRARRCIYLYVSPAKAFLLPDGQVSVPQDEVWAFLTAHMGPGKCKKA